MSAFRVLRGGSFIDGNRGLCPTYRGLCTTYRISGTSENRYRVVGFRLVVKRKP